MLVAYDLPDTQKRIVLKMNGAVTIERKPLPIDPAVQAITTEELVTRLEAARNKLAAMSQRYLPSHPKMVEAMADVRNAESLLQNRKLQEEMQEPSP